MFKERNHFTKVFVRSFYEQCSFEKLRTLSQTEAYRLFFVLLIAMNLRICMAEIIRDASYQPMFNV